MFHGLPEELQLTAVMCAMQFAPATRQSNSDALDAQRRAKRQKEEALKQLGLEKATEEHIECLIYHMMYGSERFWKTTDEVREGMKGLRYKKDKEQALKDNIQMRFRGLGWVDCHTTWSKDGKKKTLHTLQGRFIEILGLTDGWEVPEKPLTKVPRRKITSIMGTLCMKVQDMDKKAEEHVVRIDQMAREKWKVREASGQGSVLMDMQKIGDRPMDESFIGTRIEMLSNFDMDDEGIVKEAIWCSGIVEDVSDGTWIIAHTRRRYKANEAARVNWDAVPSANFLGGRSVEIFKSNKWNQNDVGAWRKDMGEVDYGIF